MITKRRDYLLVFLCISCACVFILWIDHELLKNQKYNSAIYPIEYEESSNDQQINHLEIVLNKTELRLKKLINTEEPKEITNNSSDQNSVFDKKFTSNTPSTTIFRSRIDRVVDDYYSSIKDDLKTVRFFNGESYLDHVPIFGGTPQKIMIMTTWRSGSTFLGELITSLPGNFYHYEPLFFLGSGRLRGLTGLAMKHLNKLFDCDYKGMRRYLRYIVRYNTPFEHNLQFWDVCKENKDICFNTTFLNKICRVFPIQTMKIIRLMLSKAITLLSDPTSNIKILFLLRDPRGSYYSRIQRSWCVGQRECEGLSYLCNDLVADFKAAVILNKIFPDRFRVVRYEELAMDPYGYAEKIFDFLQLGMHPNVKEFLDTHTWEDDKVVDSSQTTFRNSKSIPYKWRQRMSNTLLHRIETECAEAMRLWGYVRIENNPWLNDTNLIRDFSLNSLNGHR